MVQRPGFTPVFSPQLQGQVAVVPTPGMGYLIGPQDTLTALLLGAYGNPGLAFAEPFMTFNGHLAPAAFADLGASAGALLYFPQLAQLQGTAPSGFLALDALFAQAGMPSAGAAAYFQQLQAAPAADPALAAWLQAVMSTGYVPQDPESFLRWVDASRTTLSDPQIRSGAQDAIREGRTTQGPRGTRPTEPRVQGAIQESWTPRTQQPNRLGVVPMSQLDYNQQLGNGDRTIRRSGCFLTAMTMAASRITQDTSLNPAVANDRIRAAGGFSGSNLRADRAANALGMTMTDRRAINGSNRADLMRRLDASLDGGRPVVAGVNHTDGRSSSGVSSADHFITITGRNADGSYAAIDPAGGREITLRLGSDGRLQGRSPSGSRSYSVAELAFFERR